VGQPLLVRGAEGAAPDTGVAAVRNVQDGEDQVNTAVKKERRKRVPAGQSIKIGCKFVFSLRATDAESEVLLVRVGVKEHVNANGHLAHPEHKHANLSDEAKDWVYEKLLSGTQARTIIDGAAFVAEYRTHANKKQADCMSAFESCFWQACLSRIGTRIGQSTKRGLAIRIRCLPPTVACRSEGSSHMATSSPCTAIAAS
jgi:hypothetical protein